MEHDTPPSDAEVLQVIQGAGGSIAPDELLDRLCELEYTRDNVIKAIQRVFDRGYVKLTESAELEPLYRFREKVAAAA